MNKRIKAGEIVMLTLPVLLLVGTGLVLRGRAPALEQTQLKVQEVRFRKLPRQGTAPQRLGISVFVGYTGREPAWWSRGVQAEWLQNIFLLDAAGKEYSIYDYGGGPGAYDAERQCRVLEHSCSLPAGYDAAKSGYFKGTAVFANQLIPLKALGSARFIVALPAQNSQ